MEQRLGFSVQVHAQLPLSEVTAEQTVLAKIWFS